MCQRTTGKYSIESVHQVTIYPYISVRKLLADYDWVDPLIKPVIFHSSFKALFKSPTLVKVGLMYFGDGVVVYDTEIRAAANRDKLRLLDVAGLLSLGNQYPDLQFYNKIASIEPLWVDGEGRCQAVYLHAGPPGRCVKLHRVWPGWVGGYRFAVILPT